jgi:copper homeostasis protein
MLLEICVDSLESAIAAIRGGAQRLELCSALPLGGITPSAGLIFEIRQQSDIELSVLIRPRAGDFVYTDSEFATMKQDVLQAKKLGLESIAIGILDFDGNIDFTRTSELVDLARPLTVTFHRAFDMTPDPFTALEQGIACGVDRILTSGGSASAIDSLDTLSRLCLHAKNRVDIMPGGGINAHNIAVIARQTGATEFHAGLKTRVASPVRVQKEAVFLGKEVSTEEIQQHDHSRIVVREEDVRALRKQLSQLMN